jgi:ABC-type branched-subunit amino acid transport system ATPase component/branched-subunit amino acid ABC-type transport system permease component
MQEVILYIILGLGIGSIYSLTAQGLITIYRGAGILNFAQGAIGTVAAYVYWEMDVNHGVPFGIAFVAGVASSVILGVVTQVAVIRRLRRGSALARVVATLGVLTLIQSVLEVIFGDNVNVVPSELPTSTIKITNTIQFSAAGVILVGIALVVSVGLALLYGRTRFGLATSASTENEPAAEALGWSPDTIAIWNWALGSGLAGAATILVVPTLQLRISTMTTVVLAAVAAALLANFKSFIRAFWAALGIGVIESLVERYVSVPGLGQAVPFLVVIGWLVLVGRGLPTRDFILSRLPSVGTGRIRWILITVLGLVICVIVPGLLVNWQIAIANTFATALILLSIVVLTGYAGQLSLAQYTLAGIGAFIAGRLDYWWHLSFLEALVLGVVLTVPVGLAFAGPALRTRGISLAVVTLGLASAVEIVVFESTGNWAGGYIGTNVGSVSLFGFNLSPILYPARYTIMCILAFIIAAIVVGNVRRGRSGRRLLATRANERAAAALGISVAGSKLYAFGLAAAIAALGGILLAFQNTNISYTGFTDFASITMVAYAMVGGIGYLWGPLIGATFVTGTIGSQILNTIAPNAGNYLGVIGGALLIFVVLTNQDGIASEQLRQIAGLRRLVLRGRQFSFATRKPRPQAWLSAEVEPARVAPRTLAVDSVTVRFGVVSAVNQVSLTVRPGTVVGLIGPNGAGKTTAIDAITGFVPTAEGSIKIDDHKIGGWRVSRRARAGISRTFQSLELFEDMTVIDNLRAACDRRDWLAYLLDLVAPHDPPLSPEAILAIRHFGLSDHLNKHVSDLSYGERRLVAIARALASAPSVLLLDEPAAGLALTESGELAALVRQLVDDWGVAVLLVEHNMDFVMSICDEIAVMDFGRKIAQGTPAEVRADPAVIAAYLGTEQVGTEQANQKQATVGPVTGLPPVAGPA